MMNKDKISIIVPCYNVSDYLLNCFDYIKKQTYGFDNLEVIFVDDISSDNTWNLLESLRNDYPNNVKIFKLDKKGNSGGARNKGIDNCSGKYLTFVDADDFIHPMMLEIFYKQMLIDDYDIVQNESFMYFDNLPKLKEIKAIGLSNFQVAQIQEIIDQCEIPPMIMQVECHPYYPAEHVYDFCKKNHIQLQSWYPLGHGNSDMLKEAIFVELAKKYHKSTVQIILRWHLQMGFGLVPGSKSLDHIESNAQIFDFELTNEEMKEIEKVNKHTPFYKVTKESLQRLATTKCNFEEGE